MDFKKQAILNSSVGGFWVVKDPKGFLKEGMNSCGYKNPIVIKKEVARERA